MAIVCVGIDLAKNVFALHGVNEAGKAELIRPAVPRDKLHELIVSLPPGLIGMEACSGAYHWARLFQAAGHTVRLIAPKFVTPYRMTGKRGKNDAADAAAICEAIQRPHMRFVPIKDVEQQSRLMVHRARQVFVEQRTATLNRIRGMLSKFGVVLPLKAATVRRRARQLMQLSGVGPTTATCLLAMIGNGHDFDCGRQFAAWLGLTPGQYSSGGKARLGRVTKAGDAYLRSLLVLGAKALLAAAKNKTDAISRWALALAERRGEAFALPT